MYGVVNSLNVKLICLKAETGLANSAGQLDLHPPLDEL